MNKKLPILAIETSADLCSVAVMIDKKTYSEKNLNQKHVHSEKLIDIITNVMNDADVGLTDLAYIAISVGPGSFTGLRIGMAAVKGLAFGANLPIVPVPAFEALAYKICNIIQDEDSFIITNNVNQTELYYAKYVKKNDGYVIIDKLQLIRKDSLKMKIEKDDLIFGNYYNYDPLKSIAYPTAIDIAKWSYIYGEDLVTFDYDYIEPNYLKNFDIKVKK